MRRSRRADLALLVLLAPAWLAGSALHLREVTRGGLAVPGYDVSPAESVSSYPRVLSVWPGAAARASNLRRGDALLRVGSADLRGASRLEHFVRVAAREPGDRRVRVVFERDGQPSETTLEFTAARLPWRTLPLTLTLGATATLLFLRRRDRLARGFFLSAMAVALHMNFFFGGSPAQTHVWIGVFALSAALVGPLTLRFLWLFSAGQQRRDADPPWWPWLFALYAPAVTSFLWDAPLTVEQRVRLVLAFNVAGVATGLTVITRRFRSSDAPTRRQLKWLLYGLYLGGVPLVAASVATAVDARLWWLHVVALAWGSLTPLCILVGIVRFNLFDIDRLISATAAYTALAVVFLAAVLAGVPRLAQAASELAGIDPSSGQIALSVALAALLVPIQGYLRPQIDRLFFKEHYLLDQGIAELLPGLSDCVDARDLIQRAGDGIHRLLRPESCVVYAGGDGSYSPVYVQGRAVPPAFDGSSPLVTVLRERREPLALGDAGRRPDAAPLGPFDRAALETLDAELIAPVRHGEMLLAFLCLGPKWSGDVYTSTDVSHLAVVAEKVSASMLRFDQEEVIRQGRVMQESLRRYVPGAVAQQLASGGEPVSGEREVTVLFVDLRGYTHFSEGRPPTEVFSSVSQYTEVVSAVVSRHGGAVLEFNGDGMMAVFGAPSTMEHKEQAAVLAGIEMASAVHARAGAREQHAGRSGSVGVGIATGLAFVGNVQAADRKIWTAIGSSVNLAARLQALTHDLGASIAIDERTRSAAGAAAWFVPHERTLIRGLSEPQTVYALPLDPGT